MLEMLLIK